MKIRNILVQKNYDDVKNKFEYTVKESLQKGKVRDKKTQIKLVTTYNTYEDLMKLLEGSDFFYEGEDTNEDAFILKKINPSKQSENDLFMRYLEVADSEDSLITLNVVVQHLWYDCDLPAKEYEMGNYIYDSKNRVLKYNGIEERRVSKIESMILKNLIKNKNNLVTRDLLLQQIWKKNDYYCSRSLDVYISKLRKYFLKDSEVQIENIRGAGFRLNVPKD